MPTSLPIHTASPQPSQRPYPVKPRNPSPHDPGRDLKPVSQWGNGPESVSWNFSPVFLSGPPVSRVCVLCTFPVPPAQSCTNALSFAGSLPLDKIGFVPKTSRNADVRRLASHFKSWTYLRSSVFIPAAVAFSLLRPHNPRKLCSVPTFISWGDRARTVKAFVPQIPARSAPSSGACDSGRKSNPGKSRNLSKSGLFFQLAPDAPALCTMLFRAQFRTSLKPTPIHGILITHTKKSYLLRIGFVPQKPAPK